MFFRTVFSFAVVVVLVPLVVGIPWQSSQRMQKSPEATLHNTITIIELEDLCVRQGGTCMWTEDCPPGHEVKIFHAEFCPAQRHLGVGCCYSNTTKYNNNNSQHRSEIPPQGDRTRPAAAATWGSIYNSN